MVYKISVFMLTIASMMINLDALAKRNANYFVEIESDKTDYYCNEAALITVWLYTADPNVSGYSDISGLKVVNGSFAYNAGITDLPPVGKKVIDNKEYIAVPMKKYAVTFDKPGKYELDGGSYRIGVEVPVVVDDPWYGKVRTFRTETLDVKSRKSSVRVRNIPLSPDFDCNGCVGEYKISVVVPKGEIIINEPATAIVEISGTGYLGEDVIPDYQSAFTSNTSLKSMNEKTEYYYDGRNLRTHKILECEFIPKSRTESSIGKIRFDYFNPKTKKYQSTESEPISIDVKSSTVKLTPFEI